MNMRKTKKTRSEDVEDHQKKKEGRGLGATPAAQKNQFGAQAAEK